MDKQLNEIMSILKSVLEDNIRMAKIVGDLYEDMRWMLEMQEASIMDDDETILWLSFVRVVVLLEREESN